MFEDIKHKQRFLLEIIEAIETMGHAQPIVNNFYECFNGSYVYVFDKIDNKTPPMSDGLREALEDTPLKLLFELKSGISSGYRSVVLTGGHGAPPRGEKPGEVYAITSEGAFDIDEKGFPDCPIVVGMGLKRLVGDIHHLDTIQKPVSS